MRTYVLMALSSPIQHPMPTGIYLMFAFCVHDRQRGCEAKAAAVFVVVVARFFVC